MTSRVVTDLAEKILDREQICAAVFEADIARMKKTTATPPIWEGLQLLAEAPPRAAELGSGKATPSWCAKRFERVLAERRR